MAPSRVDNRQCSGSESLMIFPSHDAVSWLSLTNTLVESYRADCRTVNVEKTDVSTVVECRRVDLPKIDDLALLVEKGAGSTHDVGSVDHRLVKT